MEGEQQQTPPSFSAKNIGGQRSYSLARKGVGVTPQPTTITIYGIRLLRFDLPHLTIQIECSKGTYIRSLAHDVGERLGCGATLIHLRRTASGGYTEASLMNIDEIIAE
jgi:tRNA pseudouridine55 synthase